MVRRKRWKSFRNGGMTGVFFFKLVDGMFAEVDVW